MGGDDGAMPSCPRSAVNHILGPQRQVPYVEQNHSKNGTILVTYYGRRARLPRISSTARAGVKNRRTALVR